MPWATVFSNVLLPLKVQRRGGRGDWERKGVRDAIELDGREVPIGDLVFDRTGGFGPEIVTSDELPAGAAMHHPLFPLLWEREA